MAILSLGFLCFIRCNFFFLIIISTPVSSTLLFATVSIPWDKDGS